MTTYMQTYINIINILYVQEILPSLDQHSQPINCPVQRCLQYNACNKYHMYILLYSAATICDLHAHPPSTTLPSYLLFSPPLLFVFFSLRLRPCHPFILFTQPFPGPDPARAPSLTIISP